jgi:hypothetical protein
MENEIFIVVSLQIAGVHKWLNCPFTEVAHLKNDHRHIFHIKVKKRVTHSDRDIEILMFKADILQHFNEKFTKYHSTQPEIYFGKMSCEDIALYICRNFDAQYCEVLEDGENGAEVYYYPEMPF